MLRYTYYLYYLSLDCKIPRYLDIELKPAYITSFVVVGFPSQNSLLQDDKTSMNK